MQIKKIHIEGFGVFHEHSMDGFTSGVNVLYGNNEAGKSTLLDFIRFTLFDYPRTIDERRPPLNGGNHGGSIWMEARNSDPLKVFRTGDKKKFEFEHKNAKSKEKYKYSQLMGNATSDLFQHIFAITLDELVGINSLETSGMEERIFSMEMGLSGINFGEFEQKLADESESYFLKSGVKQRLIKLVDQLHQKEDKIALLRQLLDEYNILAAEKEWLTKEREEINSAVLEKESMLSSIQNKLNNFCTVVRYLSASEQLKALGEIIVLPEETIAAFTSSAENLKLLLQKAEDGEALCENLQKEVSSIALPKGYKSQAEKLNFLSSNDKYYRETIINIQQLEGKLAQTATEKDTIMQQLGPQFKMEELLLLNDTFSLKNKAVDIKNEQEKIENKIAQAEAILHKIEKDIASSEEQFRIVSASIHQQVISSDDSANKAKRKLAEMDVRFQRAIQQPLTNNGKNKRTVFILIAVVALIGIGVFFRDQLIGGLLLTVSVIATLFYFIAFKKNSQNKENESIDPVDINQEKENLRNAITAYELLIQEKNSIDKLLQSLVHDREEEKKEFNLLLLKKKEIRRKWEDALLQKGLPSILQPQRMDEFLSIVDKLALLERNQQENTENLERLKQFKLEFEEKVAELFPQGIFEYEDLEQIKLNLTNNEKLWGEQQQLSKQLQKQQIQLAEVKEKIDKAEAQQAKLFEKAKVKNKDAFLRLIETQQELAKWKQEQQNTALLIKESFGIDEFERVIKELSSTNLETLETEQLQLQHALDALKEKHSNITFSLGEKTSALQSLLDKEGLFELQNEQNSLKEMLHNESKEYLSLQLAQAVLKQAKNRFEKEKQPAVIQHTNEYFRRITEGRYSDLRISLSNKEVLIFDSKGKEKSIKDLSRGTREQLLLSLRLGLIEEYEKNSEPLPVVLDDILVNSDAQRTAIIADILKDFAKNRQVLFFTCHEHTKTLFQQQGATVLAW